MTQEEIKNDKGVIIIDPHIQEISIKWLREKDARALIDDDPWEWLNQQGIIDYPWITPVTSRGGRYEFLCDEEGLLKPNQSGFSCPHLIHTVIVGKTVVMDKITAYIEEENLLKYLGEIKNDIQWMRLTKNG